MGRADERTIEKGSQRAKIAKAVVVDMERAYFAADHSSCAGQQGNTRHRLQCRGPPTFGVDAPVQSTTRPLHRLDLFGTKKRTVRQGRGRIDLEAALLVGRRVWAVRR